MAPTIGRVALDNGFHGSIPGDWVAPPPQNIHEVPRIFRKSSMKYTILSVALFSADILKRALLGFRRTHIMPQYPQNKHPNDIM